jgi:RNA polymerase sigma factor (sigma-70 family)
MSNVDTSAKRGRGQFPTTRWSLILATHQKPTASAREALASLCESYWYPLYAWVRRQGHAVEDAQDLTQGFFAVLLEKDYLADFDRERGRFRSFLLGAFKHYVANEHDRQRAGKRGGGQPLASLDVQDAERRYSLEPAHGLTPERIYDRRWALVLLDRALERLRQESAPSARFDRLRVFLTGDPPGVSYSQLAAELGIGEGAAKVAVHRLRRRYRDVLLAEIAETVAGPEQVEEEMRFLLSAVSA